MSWLTRKLAKSDWSYPVDYEAYFEKKRVQKEMDTWVKERLIEEQRRENIEIWEQYTKARNITV